MTPVDQARSKWHAVRPAGGVLLVALALFAWAAPAAAQVYKCVDKAGRVTYQQRPCPVTQKGAQMDLPQGGGSVQDAATDAEWAGRASRAEVGVGMPRSFVVQAYGTPQETRPGRADEKAVEVWRYQRSDLDLALGFNKGVVAWTKSNPSDAPEAAPDPVPSRRKEFFVTRKCADLAAEAGPPSAVKEELDEPMARLVMRHVWEPEPGDRERTTVTCVDGVVARVERIPMP